MIIRASVSSLEQQVSPDIDQVARAIARKFRWRIQPSGTTAMNILGLSTQVPGRVVYLSDGPDRGYKIRQYDACLRAHRAQRGRISAKGNRSRN
jgi:hypothetical protein